MSSIHHHDYQHQFYYSLKLNKYLDFFFLENRRIRNIIFPIFFIVYYSLKNGLSSCLGMKNTKCK